MKTGTRLPVLLQAVALFFIFFQASAQQRELTVKIGVTTDVHGAYFPGDWYTGKTIEGSLAQVSAWAQVQRRLPGQELVLLDNGDLIQGDPASYYTNYVVPDQQNVAARILNFMGYSAATVGNHDLEAGHPVYDKLLLEYNFPWMAANAVHPSTGEPWFKPYTIIERKGFKIAVLGLITPKVPDWLPQALWSGMEFRDMIGSARTWVPRILALEKPDLMVGLFHAGVDPTYGQQQADKPLNENAARLVAEQVPGFDIVFTGHDHRSWNLRVAGPQGDSVLILGSESRAKEIAVATVSLKKKGSRWNVASLSGSHAALSKYPPDPRFMEKFGGYIDSVRQYVDQPVGTFTGPLSSEGAYFGPDEFMSLIHQAQLDLTGADISFAAPLSFRSYIPQGTVRVKDLFRLYRFENQLYTISLTGKEILGYLNYSYSLWMKPMTVPGDQMLNMEQGSDGSWRFRNAYYNFDSAEGIDYTVDLTKPSGSMVTISGMSDGSRFDPHKQYKVALNSYRGSGGGNHLSRGAGLSREEVAGRLIQSGNMDFRFLLTEWIRNKGTIHPAAAGNWKTVPEAWARQAERSDSARLFSGQK